MWRILFILYIALLVYLLFFSERQGRGDLTGYRINLVPLREIRRFLDNRDTLGTRAVLLNVYGNVLLFVPFGALLPVMLPKVRSFLSVLGAGALFSVCVETAQLVSRRGSFDVDDVLLNTAGAAAGYLLFALVRALRGGRKRKRRR